MSHLLVEFGSAASCEKAIYELRERGVDRMEAFMPYPVKSIQRALRIKRSPLPWFVFGAGLTGACLAYLVLWYTNVFDYPINIGGRPDHAVPAFVPITFETTVLFAGTTAFFLGFVLAGLPRFYDSVFEVPAFDRVMVDRWFLALDANDPALVGQLEDGGGPAGLRARLDAEAIHEFAEDQEARQLVAKDVAPKQEPDAQEELERERGEQHDTEEEQP